MLNIAAVLAPSLIAMALQATLDPSSAYRDEFRTRPDTARISKEFADDAWVALLYASRLDSADPTDYSRNDRTDAEMEKLRAEVKTDGEWLFWFHLKNYSNARLLAAGKTGDTTVRSMQDANACRSALMAANRAHVMTANMAACELVQQTSPARR